MLRLITIPISHYCEKARWALDRAGLQYREERHVQGVHRVAARRAGAGPTVPVLLTPQGAIGESAEIVAWVDQRLSPQRRLIPSREAERKRAQALCARLDERLGPSARRLIYVHMMADRPLLLRFNNQGVPRWEDRMLRWAWPAMAAFVRRALEIEPGVEARDEPSVWRELDFVAELLADGRPYLCGERFGVADLTFASLSAAVVLPPLYGVALPQPPELATATEQLVLRARAHPAGRHALRMYAEQRPPRATPPGEA